MKTEFKPKHQLDDVRWITKNDELQRFCAQWISQPYICLDTEFIRTQTYYPIAGLIQVADEQGSYFIDPLTVSDWQPFAEVLSQPLVLKVMHAMSEDIEVFQKLMPSLKPEALIDTQIATALLGMDFQISFQKLVKQTLNINLDKNQTRSNWLKRPLTDEQIYYAQEDVHYLYKAYPKLMLKLKKLDREAWLIQECANILAEANSNNQLANYYTRIKLAWKLNPKNLFVLKQLAIWRERKAQQLDVIRSKFVQDDSLWRIARFLSKNEFELKQAGLSADLIEQYGAEILEIVVESQKVDERHWPSALPKPLSIPAGEQYKKMRKKVVELARKEGVTPELLARKKELQTLIRSGDSQRSYQLPNYFKGWRYNLVGKPLLDWLANQPEIKY